MTFRRWSTWLGVMALLVAATWMCVRVGCAFEEVERAAERTAVAMEGTAEYQAATWELGPPPE